MGKQTRVSFKFKNMIATSRALQLLYMDLFGPTRTLSLGGKQYAFIIVDDYLRFTSTFFLTYKDETIVFFTKFCKKVQNKKMFYNHSN